MGVRVQVHFAADEDGTATADLYRWLRHDRTLRRQADIRLHSDRPDSAYMGALDTIELLFQHGAVLTGLALNYATWWQGRAREESVTIRVGEASVTVPDGSEESVRRIVELLRSVQEPAAGSPDTSGSGSGET
ncbi:hypothetical protein [Streptomyces sp. NPDC008240]|uniref:effector-associated constant component EACC1 n=1 Tax=Streptomyces sp. NPDC008240 TaxID=3364822 RepID=UPI0036F12918